MTCLFFGVMLHCRKFFVHLITPSSHLPVVDSHPDLAELDDLMDEDSDGGATLAEDVKGKAVESLDREESPEPEAGTSCPKKPRTTVQKRRASSDAR